ncbi:uncharacterized protein [Antedon mediterranea]|uniref:uncharacterized protein n=1 Tax=Antedon mediterranea TaxID=105859 RepID=UPI003AF4F47E
MSSFTNGRKTENGNIVEYVSGLGRELESSNWFSENGPATGNDWSGEEQLELEDMSSVDRTAAAATTTDAMSMTTGEYRSALENQDRDILVKTRQSYVEDGRVLSMIVFFLLTSFYIAFLFAFYGSGRHPVHGDTLDWSCIIFDTVSVTVIILILRRKKSWQRLDLIRCPKKQLLPNDERQPLLLEGSSPGNIHSQNYSEHLVGVYIFGICNIVLALTNIVVIGKCVPLLSRRKEKYRETVFVAYNCFKVFFTIAQVAFFRSFRGASFKNCSFFQYVFILTMSANVLSWMENIAKESILVLGIKVEYQELTWPLIHLQPANITSNSYDEVVWCYSVNALLVQIPIQKFLSVFQPFSQEYNILAVSILLHYWTSLHSNDDRSENIGSVSDTENCGSRQCGLLTNRTLQISTAPNDSMDCNIPSTNRRCSSRVLIIFVVLLLMSIFVISMTEFYTLHQHDSVSIILIFSLIIYKSTMIIAIILAKKYLDKNRLKLYKSLNRSEILLLICLIGVFVLSCCDGISATGNLIADFHNLTETVVDVDKSEINYSIVIQTGLIVLTVINLVQSTLQTMLILKSRRSRGVDDGGNAIIRRSLIYLMITNVTQWLIILLVSPDNEKYSTATNDLTFGNTIVIINIIFLPLAAYYRFTSIDLLYQASKPL